VSVKTFTFRNQHAAKMFAWLGIPPWEIGGVWYALVRIKDRS